MKNSGSMKKLLLLFGLLSIFSCKKSSNKILTPISFSGQVYDSTIRKGMPNVSIVASWITPGNIVTNIVNSSTDSNGYFVLNALIDTSKFNNGSINIYLDPQLTFLTLSTNSTIIDSYHPINPNIQFNLYETTTLTINFIRSAPDTLMHVEVYKNNQFQKSDIIYNSNYSGGVILPPYRNVDAPVNKYTSISVLKVLSNKHIVYVGDSIFVHPNSHDTLSINY